MIGRYRIRRFSPRGASSPHTGLALAAHQGFDSRPAPAQQGARRMNHTRVTTTQISAVRPPASRVRSASPTSRFSIQR